MKSALELGVFGMTTASRSIYMYYDSLSTDLIKASAIGVIVRIVSYTIDGKLDRIENYSDGLPFVNSEYYANGQMREIIHYEDGAPSGGLCWYANGGINEMFAYKRLYKEQEDTDKKMVKLAPKRIVYKKWFENGKVAINGQVDAIGNKLGTWYEYDIHGNTLQSIEN
jgi:antitoxin component YwqK of YwqJK toxin-antitoxin module